jgi:hypothetical protein
VIRNAYKILSRKLEGNRSFGRPRYRLKDTLKVDLREIG